MKTTGCFSVLGLAAGVLAQAHAGLLDIAEDADSRAIGPLSDTIGSHLTQFTGIAGAHVIATTAAPIGLRFEFLFKEASLANTFWVNGQEIFNSHRDTPGAHYSMIWHGGAQALDFKFVTGRGNSVANASDAADQNDGHGAQNFAIFWDGLGDEMLLALDDGGANRDGDYNDFIIRITSFIVPEPSTLALFGAGLAGFSLTRRRTRLQ